MKTTQITTVTTVTHDDEILTEAQWAQFCAAEKRLYNGEYAMKFSDVREREDSAALAALWADAVASLEVAHDDASDTVIQTRAAYRVAQAQALIVFGPEFLLK